MSSLQDPAVHLLPGISPDTKEEDECLDESAPLLPSDPPTLAGYSTAQEETSQHTFSGNIQHGESVDTMLSSSSAIVTGTGSLIPMQHAHDQCQQPVQVQEGRNQPHLEQRNQQQKLPKGCCIALCVVGIGCLLCAGTVVSIAVLLFHPNPDVTVPQIAFEDDTVPLLITLDGDLPHSYDTTWYDWFAATLVDQYYTLTVLFVSGDHACDPPVNNTNTDKGSPPSIDVDPDSFPVEVVTKVFLPSGANFQTNFTLTLDPAMETESRHKNNVILFCILDNLDSYTDFTNDEGDLDDCIDHERYTYPIINGSIHTMNYTVQKSSYYFILLLATSEVTIKYSYILQYQFYDFRNYSNAVSCNITEENNWKDCILSLNGSAGCFFAHSSSPEQGFTRFKAGLHHIRFGTISIGVLAAGICSLILCCIIATVVCVLYRKRKCCFKENR